MGAGGNVVGYSQAPNSHFDVRQTESLIVRKDGSYIENVGVTPDVVVPVANYTASKYKEVRAAAIKALD
jgi:C-terminal processing protease CtpA/Prc